MTPHPNLSDLLAVTADHIAHTSRNGTVIGPREARELAACLNRWAALVQRLETMAGACAATIAAAELAAIEGRTG